MRQASKVRCPELCGRGASSLTSSAAVARHEELDAQEADVLERFHHASRDVDRLRAAIAGGDVGGRHRDVEDVMRVRVLDRSEMRPLAVDAARADHRHLAIEIDERLEDRLAASERVPRARR